MRKTYHYDPVTKEMVEGASPRRGSTSIQVMGDIPDVLSPIDGRIIHGRAGMRAHNKEHNVTNMADFKDQWANAEKQRASMYTGDTKFDQARRREKIIQAVEKHYKR